MSRKDPLWLTGLAGLLGLLMLAGAVGHVVAPELYAGFIPEPIPHWFANGFAVVVEGAIGVALFAPRLRSLGGLAFAVLMVGFMPLHIWDALKDAPAIGEHTVAYVRIAIQVLFIGAGALIYKRAGASG